MTVATVDSYAQYLIQPLRLHPCQYRHATNALQAPPSLPHGLFKNAKHLNKKGFLDFSG